MQHPMTIYFGCTTRPALSIDKTLMQEYVLYYKLYKAKFTALIQIWSLQRHQFLIDEKKIQEINEEKRRREEQQKMRMEQRETLLMSLRGVWWWEAEKNMFMQHTRITFDASILLQRKSRQSLSKHFVEESTTRWKNGSNITSDVQIWLRSITKRIFW